MSQTLSNQGDKKNSFFSLFLLARFGNDSLITNDK